MADDPNRPVELTTARTELQAALIVAALSEQRIEAHSVGALTSELRAETMGEVAILVRQVDLERAQAALQAMDARQRSSHGQ